MRAVVLNQPGEPVHVEDLVLEEPHAGEVRVRITASGVCHSDLHVRDADWVRPGPIALGHEGAGIVEALGAGVDPGLLGRQVALSWYYPCLRCRHCQEGRQWLCTESRSLDHHTVDGTTRLSRSDGQAVMSYLAIGTMAERTVVPAEAAIPIPDAVRPEVAALIGCCVTTGVGAVLKTAAVEPGASVAVFGLGGVGLSVVMGAVVAGATRIVAVDRVPEKLERAVDLGATHAILATDADATVRAIREATGGGPDYAFEAIGLPATIEQTIACLPHGGTAVLVGLTRFGARASFEVFPFVDGSLRILGSNYGFAVAANDFPRYAELHLAGRLPIDKLVEARIGLDDVEDAFDRMRRGEGLRRVIVP
jgi:S-(hydroxymethyl)glutathione dehydrogenase / alcohol dehydrogenase